MIVVDEVKRLKNEIKALRKSHNKPDVAKEELLTFEMLDRYRHIVQQQAWPCGGRMLMPYTLSQTTYPPG